MSIPVLYAMLTDDALRNITEKIDTTSELVYDTGMYAASRIMRGLQYIYDFNLICDWYDDILYSNSLPEPENN